MNDQANEIASRLSFAIEIAKAAGDVTLRYFRGHDLVVEDKADMSPVTIADRSAEELLRARIGQSYSADGIIGEEFGSHQGTSDYTWTLDPIDGTKSFIHGVPLYTTIISVLHSNEPCLGVIHAPALQETVYAGKGSGCWYLGGHCPTPQRSSVSAVKVLNNSLLLTSEIEGFRKHRRADAMDVFMDLQRKARVGRTWGDGYGYMLVATGRAEVMIDPLMNLWDAAPLQTIIEEAGGHFSDWQGKPTVHSGEAVATNSAVRDEVLAIIRGNS
jgi:histidinol-phosphatase